MVQANGQTIRGGAEPSSTTSASSRPFDLGWRIEAFCAAAGRRRPPAIIEHGRAAPSIAALHRKIAGERLSRNRPVRRPWQDGGCGALFEDRARRVRRRHQPVRARPATRCQHLNEAIDRGRPAHRLAARGPAAARWSTNTASRHPRQPHLRCWVVPIVTAHWHVVPERPVHAAITLAGRTARHDGGAGRGRTALERCSRSFAAHAAAMAWGGTATLSPADDILISVERPLAIDSPGQWWLRSCPRRSPPVHAPVLRHPKWGPAPKDAQHARGASG